MSSQKKSSKPALEGLSSPVRSSQQGVHPQLAERVKRHLRSEWREPLHKPTVTAFGQLQGLLLPGEEKRLVLDSGCGTGVSTTNLGRKYPQSIVIGVDRSAVRLARGGHESLPARRGHCIWMRAELASFWRLALDAGWKLQRHFLLYPNPSPKPSHLQRRWHAHPVFPAMLTLGGELELRCNWLIYAQEFALAVEMVTGQGVVVEPLPGGEDLTPFERKYLASGHELFRVTVPDRDAALTT